MNDDINDYYVPERKKALKPKEKLELMSEYVKKTGNQIKNTTVYRGHKIGIMQINMRAEYRQGKLKMDEKMIKEFQKIGVLKERERAKRTNDDVKYDFFMKKYEEGVRDFKKDKKSRQWLNDLRVKHNRKTIKLSKEQISDLQRIGVLILSKNQNEKYQKLYGISEGEVKILYQETAMKDYENIEEYVDALKLNIEQTRVERIKRTFIFSSNAKTILQRSGIIEIKNKIKKLNDEVEDEEKIDEYINFGEIENAMKNLSDKEKTVLKKRGLGSGKKHSLEEIAKGFNVIRERIRQIEVKALNKINFATNNLVGNIIDDIYEKILYQKVPKEITEKMPEEEKNAILEDVKNSTTLYDLCIPNRIISELNEYGINNMARCVRIRKVG